MLTTDPVRVAKDLGCGAGKTPQTTPIESLSMPHLKTHVRLMAVKFADEILAV